MKYKYLKVHSVTASDTIDLLFPNSVRSLEWELIIDEKSAEEGHVIDPNLRLFQQQRVNCSHLFT